MNTLARLISSLPVMAFIHLALAIVFLFFGIAKFAHYEQVGVAELVSGHPVLGLVAGLLGPAGFGILLGVVELTIAALFLVGLFSARLGFVAGIMGSLTFLTTLTILPFAAYFEPEAGRAFLSLTGQFLLKDLGLLAACLAVARYHASDLDLY